MKIAFCQATWRGDFDLTKECIERVEPYVDFVVITFDQTLTEDQLDWLENWVVSDSEKHFTTYYEFKDNLPDMRNSYLEVAKNLGADWVCVSDPDELYSEDLAKNLRILIEEHENLGYNLLPVPVRDQFENVEWLDDLDILKECPGGYRESDFWKPMLIFKLSPSTTYQGVGLEKNVHESLISSQDWKVKNLPKEFFYIHKKSAFKIWRNAARNMFIGGGGDNVGRMNPLWEELRIVCARFKANDWVAFEEFVKGGKGMKDESFLTWLIKALQIPPTNWGTETRELAKWVFVLNQDSVTDEIRQLIENPPKMTREIETENYVTRAYFEVLGRPPDDEGRTFYSERILSGDMEKQDVIIALMQSEEFKALQGKMTDEIEEIKVQVPVKVSVSLSESTFIEALMKSQTFWLKIKPKLDLGGCILDSLRKKKKKELIAWYYQNKPNMTPQILADWIIGNYPKSNSVALCIMGYSKALPMILESIKIMAPYVDEIHVQGNDFTILDEANITSNFVNHSGGNDIPVEIHLEPWTDDFSGYKNKVMSYANTEWVLVFDHDEIPTIDLAENLRDVIEHSQNGIRYNKVQLAVMDEKIDDKGKIVERIKNQVGKDNLLFNVDDPYYGNPHIWLKPNYFPWKTAVAPLAYRHVKEIDTELPRSVRNVFLGGGGDNTREGNPLWVELRGLTKDLGIDTWARFHEYLKAGKADEWLLASLMELSKMPWKDDELGDPLRYYKELHPQEFTKAGNVKKRR